MVRRNDGRGTRAAGALLVMLALLGAMFVITSGSVFAQSPSASAAASAAASGGVTAASGSPAASGGVTAASGSPTAPATSTTVPGSQGGSAPILPILALLAIVAAGALVITPQHLASRQRR